MGGNFDSIASGFFMSHAVSYCSNIPAILIILIALTIMACFPLLVWVLVDDTNRRISGTLLVVCISYSCGIFFYADTQKNKFETMRLNNTSEYAKLANPVQTKYLNIFKQCHEQYCGMSMRGPDTGMFSLYAQDMAWDDSRWDDRKPVFVSGLDILNDENKPKFLWGKVISILKNDNITTVYVKISTQDSGGKTVEGIYEMSPETFMMSLVKLYDFEENPGKTNISIPECGAHEGSSAKCGQTGFHSDTVSGSSSSVRVRFERSL